MRGTAEMAHLSACRQANLRPSILPPHRHGARRTGRCCSLSSSSSAAAGFRAQLSSSSGDSGGGGSNSYLDMWKKAIERERESQVLRSTTAAFPSSEGQEGSRDGGGSLETKTELFNKILEVPWEERDRVQRLQVIDRAAAAITAARALLKEAPKLVVDEPAPVGARPGGRGVGLLEETGVAGGGTEQRREGDKPFPTEVKTLDLGAPGPDFWSWSPPPDSEGNSDNFSNSQQKWKSDPYLKPSLSLMEKERSIDSLSIPFQSKTPQSEHSPPLPPLQSIVELEKVDSMPPSAKEHEVGEIDELFSRLAAEAAEALGMSSEAMLHGVHPDGSKWWKETGVETRPDGVVCKWTLTRGVSADGAVEWEDKYWEASDQFDHKELGSEKSGRDAYGNVWREYWKESLWQDLKTGLVNIEKTADKWGKGSNGAEWHEKWWEHYDASGQAEKWADKWCSIDPNTPLQAGHAHVWHERWGETYDGKGGSVKYTDKWAERSEGDGWSKWGDKWDEHFNTDGHGVKQGETWWEGKYGERWNRTWGEGHNGSGWIHKYGRSSSGEHWDTHVQEDTWYERYPHFGFDHCFRNSVQLRSVPKPPSTF